MKLDFDNLDTTVIEKFYGGEKQVEAKMYRDDNIKIMRGKLAPGASIGVHTHSTSCEVIYFLGGRGKVIYNGQEEFYSAGECHYCPKGDTHTLINISDEDLTFVAVVPEQ